MSLVSRPTELTQQINEKKQASKRGDQLVRDFHNHIEEINSKNYFPVKSVEELLLKQMEHEVGKMGTFPDYPKHLPRFSPSSAGKCERELFYKLAKARQDEKTTHSFQNRWTRNSTAIHGATQRQLLEAEVLLPDPKFNVKRLDNGLPAWEKNIEKWKVITHNGVEMVVYGMCDGVLDYEDGSEIGYEYKTKSNSVAQIKQIKEPQAGHISQVTAYSLLFDVPEWLITYEAVAKDKWSTGENARPDFKIFYHKVTKQAQNRLLDKFARVAMNLEDGEISEPDFSKCTFCPFKSKCHGESL